MTLSFHKETFQDELRKRHAESAKKLQSCIHSENGSTRLVLIQGPCGSGKTTLARTLQQHVEASNGYFASGRFDKIGVTRPFGAFVHAMADFASTIACSRDDLVCLQEHAVIRDGTCSVLTEVVPQLKSIIVRCDADERPTESSAPVKGASQRFLYAFRAFLKAAGASLKGKLVLFLDDLHVADPCSLDLLSSIVNEDDMDGVLMVACTDSFDSEAMLTDNIGQQERLLVINQLRLDEGDLRGILSNAVMGFDGVDNLGQAAHSLFRLTEGNLVVILELLDGAGLGFLEDVKAVSVIALDQYLSHRLIRTLSDDSTKVLTAAAAFGMSIDEYLVSQAIAGDGTSVAECLVAAERSGVVRCVRNKFEFAHPLMQEAVYNLIPDGERERFHLKLGRQLWRSFDADDLDLFMYHVLSQYEVGRRLISNEKEITAVASLCLVAGRKAAKACSFRLAATYLTLGMELLSDQGWTSDYELTLSLYNAAAEMEMCNTAYDRMNALLDATLSRAVCFQDKVQAYTTRIYYLGVINEQDKAIDLGVDILAKLGERFPRRYHLLHTLREFMSVRRLVKKKSNEQLLRSPPLTDATKLACLHILQLIYLNAMLMRPTFAPLLQLRMMRITLEYGLSVFASMAYVLFGMLQIAIMQDYIEGVRFGCFAMELLDRYDAVEHVPRVYAFYYGIIHGWRHPISECFSPLLRAYEIGQESGDFEISALCATFYIVLAEGHGFSIPDILNKWNFFKSRLVHRCQIGMLNLALPAVNNLLLLSEHPPEELQIDRKVFSTTTSQGDILQEIQIRATAMIRHVIFHEFSKAYECRLSRRDFRMLPPTFVQFEMHFFCSLLYTAMGREDRQYRHLIKKAKWHLSKMNHMSLLAPHNTLASCHLIEAEILSLSGRKSKAFAEYVCSISIAQAEGMYMFGVSNERTARHFLANGDLSSAKLYLMKSCEGYERWGATLKVACVKAEMTNLSSAP